MKTLHAVLIAVCLLVTANLYSFYLGCRSGLNPATDTWTNYADSIFARIRSANYNSTTTNISSEISLSTITAKLGSLNTVLFDYRTGGNFDPTHWKSASALGLSNYMQFEAEYFNQQSVVDDDQNRDDFWYCSNSDDNNRVGSLISNGIKSNGHSWAVEPDLNTPKDGYVFSNLKWRWRPDKRIGDQFQFTGRYFMMVPEEQLETKLKDFYADKYLYVTFAIEFDAGSLAGINDNQNLLSIEFVAYPDELPGSTPIAHENMANGTSGNVTYLTKGQYELLSEDFESHNRELTIRVSLLDLYEDGYLQHKDDNYWKTIMGFLSPKLYWYGQGSLQLDYVLMHDSVYDALQTITDTSNSGNNYIMSAYNVLNGTGNPITNIDTFNEPKHPQIKSFSKIENELESEISNFPGLFTSLHDSYKDYEKPNSKGFDNPMLFLKQTKPRLFMPNPYHLEAEYNFNSDDETSVQAVLNSLCTKYRDYKFELLSSTEYAQTKYYICVQTMGYWWGQGNYPNQSDIRYGTGWSWLRPPKETQKAMQFLPLCYGVDGIHDFMFQSFNSVDEVGYWHAININNGIIEPSGEYYGLQQANKKIAVYGPLLSSPATHDTVSTHQLTWRDALNLNVSDSPITLYSPDNRSYGISDLGVESIVILPSGNGFYQGFVHAGFYKDMVNGLPSFMLVNRRANYFDTSQQYTSPKFAPPSLIDNFFSPAEPQTVRFYINQDAHTMVGDNAGLGDYVGLYDPASESLFSGTNNIIHVPIDPGDGVLLQMCGTLPELVSGNVTLNHFAVIEGNVSIVDGASVTFSYGCKTIFKEGTTVTIQGGSSLTFNENVDFENDVRIIVQDGSYITFNNTNCTWGTNSGLVISGSSVNISGGDWSVSEGTQEWQGISASQSSSLILTNITINNAYRIEVDNSNLVMQNCKIVVPAERIGLYLNNSIEGYDTIIEASSNNKGFFSRYSNLSYGISIGIMKNPVFIEGLKFFGLFTGILGFSPQAASISSCSFNSCTIGVQLVSSSCTSIIEQCTFNTCPTGISLLAAVPLIENCIFNGCNNGISSEYSLFTFGSQSGVYNSVFNTCDKGLVSRNSNHCVKENFFNQNQTGILSHAGSNLNLSSDAFNVFRNTVNNLAFMDSEPYISTIQLIKGHNDFYHLENEFDVNDFSFDADFYNIPLHDDPTIDANANWFEDNRVVFNDPAYAVYVKIEDFDPTPNSTTYLGSNRLIIALDYEAQGMYDGAIQMFKLILDDQLEAEKRFYANAADGVYRLSQAITDSNWVCLNYLDAKIVQYAIDSPYLSSLLKDYYAKTLIINKDFQSAIDLIQLRIDNPISEIDSLRAVLDLEIVLQLASLEETKKPITTKYTQYKYPNIQVFNTKHDEHWAKLYELMNKGDEENGIPIPPTPQISSNYPNPFNPSTTIAFSIPEQGVVKLTIYNLKGQKVKEILNSNLSKGHHKAIWDGRDSNNRKVSSGIYLIKLDSGGKTSLRKAMLMK